MASEPAEHPPAIDEDRISKLPDEILHLILGAPALTTRDSIIVSRLSKRWRNLWKSSPFLNLEDTLYIMHHFEEEEEDEDDGRDESFIRFVDTVLLCRKSSNLHSLRLYYCPDLHSRGQFHLYKWVQYAVNHNVKVLELHFYAHTEKVDLPRCIFTCESLEELRLIFGEIGNEQIAKLNLPASVRLSRLRELQITNMFIDSDSMKKLLLGCPYVEKLMLMDCALLSNIILFLRLKDLFIAKCEVGGDYICIHCPSLLSFHFWKNLIVVPMVVLQDLSSLVTASVFTSYDDEYVDSGNIFEYVRGFANAKDLKIISTKVESISEEQVKGLPTFKNVVNLTLGCWQMVDNFPIVAHCIKKSPKLQTLTLLSKEHNDDDSNEGQASPKCEKLWFHCPHKVISCKVYFCGSENKKLLDLVSNVIVQKYTLPKRAVRIVQSDRIQDVENC